MKQRIFIGITLLLLSLPLMIPYVLSGGSYFPTHDGEWAIVRLTEMVRELKEFQFPPRWAGYLNHGFGYPLFLFTYPFPYYLGSVLHGLGLGYVDSIKALFVFSVLGSAVSMYLFTNKLWGRRGGLLSTTLYLYAPYRLVNLYIRGSIGESLAFVLFPLIFLSFHQLLEKPELKWLSLAACAQALLIVTHNALTVLFLPFTIAWIIYLVSKQQDKMKSIRVVAVTMGISVLLSAYFWMPAIFEKKYISLSLTPLANKLDNFVRIEELTSNVWSLVGLRPPLELGLLHGLIFLSCLTLLFLLHQKQKKYLLFYCLATLAAIAMLLKFSMPIWELPLIKEIDFPWRMLAITAFMLSVLGGSLSRVRYGLAISTGLILCTALYSMQYIKTLPQSFKPDAYYETNDATTTSADELMPVWVKIKSTNRPEYLAFFQNSFNSSIANTSKSSTELAFSIYTGLNNTLILNQVYFPGWEGYIDGKKTDIRIIPDTGLTGLDTPKGSHIIEFKFVKTPVRIIADIVSLTAIVAILSVCLFSKRYFLS